MQIETDKQNLLVKNSKQKKLQCPNCGQFKMATNRSRFFGLALLAFIISGAATVFIITIPLLIVTAPVMIGAFIVAFFAKGASCANCHYKIENWKEFVKNGVK